MSGITGTTSYSPDPQPPQRSAGLYTYAQAAIYLSISERQVQRAVGRGDLVPIKMGNSVRFSRELLDDYIEACKKPRATR